MGREEDKAHSNKRKVYPHLEARIYASFIQERTKKNAITRKLWRLELPEQQGFVPEERILSFKEERMKGHKP